MSEPNGTRDIATVAEGVRECVALVACIPDPIKREGYILHMADRAGYDAGLIRREVDKMAATGNAPTVSLQLLRGEKPSAAQLREKRADRPTAPQTDRSDPRREHMIRWATASAPEQPGPGLNWWERSIGRDEEGRIVEDSGEFMYRRYQRLPIVQELYAWGRLLEWEGRVKDERFRNPDQTLFEAEFKVWHAMWAEQCADPVYRELQGLDGPDLEAEQAAEDEAVWGYGGLVDRIYDLDAAEREQKPAEWFPWLGEFNERRKAGQGDREAAEGTLTLAAKAGRTAEPGLHLRTPWNGVAKQGVDTNPARVFR